MIVTCVFLQPAKHIIISYVFVENFISCDTIIYKIFVFHISGASLHQGKIISDLEEPGTGVVVIRFLQIYFFYYC